MRILLVDDEEHILNGVSRMISLEEDEWEVSTASSGARALEILEQELFNVVVSDMRMPDMDGAQLLNQIGARYPKILRIVLSGQADRETVLRATKSMHQYLSKPCDSAQLIEAIRVAGILQETIQSPEVLDAIGKADCLPSFPQLVEEINREIASERGTSKTVAIIIAQDPMLSARVLQLANSAVFGLPNPVSDIDRAVSLIGMDMIRALALSQSVYKGNESNDQILSAHELFDHGIKVATIGQRLATLDGASNDCRNTAFTAGLLHDVGKLVLLNTFPERFKEALETSLSQNKRIEQVEMEMFGATHQGIGGYLFGLWGLPTDVIESVASHHCFPTCAKSSSHPRQLVFAANWIAGNRTDDELTNAIEAAEDKQLAKDFAAQITAWSDQLQKSKHERQ